MSKVASRLHVTKMNRTSVAVVLLMTVLTVVQTSLAEVDCSTIRIKCKSFKPFECRDNGGIFVLNGGLCGYCDACVKYVGIGANCSVQEIVPRPTPTCRPNLICAADGLCRSSKPLTAAETCPGVCTMEYDPVCGTDGNSTIAFGNPCLFEFFLRCQAKKPDEWKVTSKSNCPELRPTEPPKTNYSEKDCPGVCVAVYNPVCGSDGNISIEFDNTCSYEAYVRCQVKNSQQWKTVHNSECRKTKPEEGPKKDLEKNHTELTCPGVCSLEFDPVCGSDGVTTLVFANMCQYDFHLRCQVNNSKEWKLISNKDCPDLNKTYADRLAETCPGSCVLEYNPVCGCDGKSCIAFANKCQYDYYLRCQVKNTRDWKLVTMSICQGPATTGNDSAQSCPGMCTFEFDTMCGSDGNTTIEFGNRCQYDAYLRCEVKNPKEWKILPHSACMNPAPADDSKKNSSVDVSTSGPCPGTCSLGYFPVCGSDGKTTLTFNNKCHYDHHIRCVVDNKKEWRIMYNSTCPTPNSEEVDNSAKDSCPGMCNLEYEPICGSDGNVSVGFLNKCQYDFHLLCKVKNPKDWKIVPNIDCLQPVSNEPQKNNSMVESCPGICTSEISQLCGSGDGISVVFGNRCQYDDHLRCQAKNLQNWKIFPMSACIREKSTEGPKITSRNISPDNKRQTNGSNKRVR